jgi:putative aldouronate transport system substrate-binding protein
MTWFFTDVWGAEEVSKLITEKTGVFLDVTRSTDDTFLPIMLSSGELPDLVYTDSTPAAGQLSNPEICWPMNELVEQYGVDLSASESDLFNNTQLDGNYYTIKNTATSQDQLTKGEVMAGAGTSGLSVNRAIYEELGSPKIDTLADLEAILLAAKEAHPERVPLLNDPSYLESFFKRNLGIPVGSQYDGTKVISEFNNPQLIEYYKTTNRFAREGLISPESQTYSFEQYLEAKNSGQCFIGLRSCGESYGANDVEDEWFAVDHNLSPNALVIDSGVGWAGLYITKNCVDPEAAIRLFAFHRTEEGRKLASWGIQGSQWDYNAEGKTIRPAAFNEQIATVTPQSLGVGVWIFGDRGDEAAFIDYNTANDPEVKAFLDFRFATAKITKKQSELAFTTPTEGDEQLIYTKLVTLKDDYKLRIIFAETEAEMQKLFDEMISEAKNIGVDKLEAWQTGVINAKKAS